MLLIETPYKGPSMKDVRKRGRGLCGRLRTRGRKSFKMAENLRTFFMDGP